MEQQDVASAVAAQEEHIRRWKSCREIVGQAHIFRRFGRPIHPDATWSECVTCGVTETAEDYKVKAAG